MKKVDEPAFPHWNQFDTDDGVQGFDYPGLTKRELLAALAMQGLLACPTTELGEQLIMRMSFGDLVQDTASSAIQYADALIAELEKPRD